MAEHLANWADNVTYLAAQFHAPRSIDEIQELVRSSRRIKALGRRHSFSRIADTPGDLVSLEHLDQIEGIDAAKRTVTIQGGVTYAKLCRYLAEQGYAVHNLASLPHISVAGACATGTHGSGDHNGNLATAVSAMEVVTADGSLVTYSRERPDELNAVAVHLGGLGIVTRLTLDVVPAFQVSQTVYEGASLNEVLDRFEEVMGAGYSVSLFTGWRDSTIDQIWIKRIEGSAAGFAIGRPATVKLHPIKDISPENCTDQMGVYGSWHERLPHFRMDYLPSSGKELQSEYLVPRHRAAAAIRAINEMSSLITPLVQITEIRSVAEDAIWMSPSFGGSRIGIHFTWKKDWEGVQALLPTLEQTLAPFEARPHWGKLFALHPERLRTLYPKLGSFRQLLESSDPYGKFRNSFLNRVIWERA